ncbi:TOMM precursor leader peptide-binding protein [Corynebacterium xerosis]|uniref:TOMM leader peptide-binding protein n=1 Tax=Corynebacterium xerosis TaxID=1725 RepID=A0A6B8U054_9CORY|nr:TOMM precursor leader peptide-binding protein [Corynebacterium xerosis]QGS34955.1 TOMM precursor leader peptide-binding protein [Corynebacterium xerosis]
MGVEIGGSAPVLLHRHVPVLLRPGGRIQFGADPRTCVVFPLPEGISPGPVFSAFLSATRGSCLETELSGTELSPVIATALVAELRRAGLVDKQREPGPVTVVGRDGLRHRLVDALRLRGRTPASRTPDRDARRWLERTPTADIGTVVLTGFEVPDEPLLSTLQGRGIPHLSAVLRDGAGVVGPWTPDALAPCPACAEAHRVDEDPARRVLALQLAGRVGGAPPETVAATVATIMAQLAAPGPLRGAEVLVDPHGLRSGLRPLLPHPRCPVCAAGGRSPRR